MFQRLRTVELLRHGAGHEVVFAGDSVLALMTWMSARERSDWPHLIVAELIGPFTGDRDRAAVTALREAGVRVLLLSALHPRRAAQRIVEEGIDGVVSKSDEEAQFLHAVTSAVAGHRPITDRAAESMRPSPNAPRLSAQETRVLELYAAGQPIEEVAAEIGVRPDTARKYLSRVKEKYAAIGRPSRTRLDLARRAWEDGLIG